MAFPVTFLGRRHKPQLDQMQQRFVADATGEALHQFRMGNRIKVSAQVGIHDFRIPGVQQPVYLLDRF